MDGAFVLEGDSPGSCWAETFGAGRPGLHRSTAVAREAAPDHPAVAGRRAAPWLGRRGAAGPSLGFVEEGVEGHTEPMAVTERTSGVRTFLIADIRGYSRYTEECGDEAAAALSKKFAKIVNDDIEAHGGGLVEMRGDEALVVFTSARAAIRAAVDLQAQFREAADEFQIPLQVGIGIDSGEAVELEDGTFRGSALNVAARLCGRASGGEVIISAATSRLAGRLAGLHYSDGGRVRLKNIAEPVHIHKVYSELDARPTNRWVVLFLGRERRGLSWRLAALVSLIAAATAVAVVYVTAGGGADPTGAASRLPGQGKQVAATGLSSVVPAAVWKDCQAQGVPDARATETAACVPAEGVPDRWEISRYPNGDELDIAYRSELESARTSAATQADATP